MLMQNIFGENLMDNFFEDFIHPERQFSRYGSQVNTPVKPVMMTDVKETDDDYKLEIELPGYKKEDVTAQLKDGYMIINATANSEKDNSDEKDKYIRKERYYGSCSRSFYVGKNITEDDIKAKFENGILKIEIPKKEQKPAVEEQKYIAIEG